MGALSDMLRPLSSSRIVTMNQLLEEKADGLVTICGFEYRDGKYGRSGVFKIKECGGLKFWAAGKLLKDELVPAMQAEYGSAEAIDKAFREEPQAWKIGHVIVLKNGNRFRPIEFLGDAADCFGFAGRSCDIADKADMDDEV